jgi:23S rRNA (uracil1939-C5)-methyltransferase
MKQALIIEIEKMVYGGQGMGRADGKVIFVPFTAPGERVEVEVTREKKNYAEAVPRRIQHASPVRAKPFCQLFGECGGCQYQHLPYPEQLELKEEQVQELLGRLARKSPFHMLPLIPSPDDRGYRIRAQFKAGMREGKKLLGFYSWRTHRVVDVRECPLLDPTANEILRGLREWMSERIDVPVRGADIQVSPDERKGVVCVSLEGSAGLQTAEEVGNIRGVKGVVMQGRQRTSWGDLDMRYDWPKIGDAEELRTRTGGESFIQVNPRQNFNLMRSVVEWADLTGKEKVLDLFCGSGNLTLPLAQRAGRVWGVDQDRQAVLYAAENARANRLSNCIFVAANAADGIGRVGKESGPLDVAVLDPPRVGAHEVLKPLASLRPRNILYISCEPPTLARDLARLIDLDYRVEKVQPLDMFPQTYHIEVLVKLTSSRLAGK